MREAVEFKHEITRHRLMEKGENKRGAINLCGDSQVVRYGHS